MAPGMYTPGEEVTVKVLSKKGRNKVLTYEGIVFAGRYPELYLNISVGGRVLNLPWDRITEIR